MKTSTQKFLGLALARLVVTMFALSDLVLAGCESNGGAAGNGQPAADASCTMACGTDGGQTDGQEFGSIVVTSTPDGAAITLDWTKTAQVTPAEIKGVVTGLHTVMLFLPGWEKIMQDVQVTAGAAVNADFTLTPLPPPSVSLGMYHVWQKRSNGPDDPGGDVYEWEREIFSVPALQEIWWNVEAACTCEWHCYDSSAVPDAEGWIHGECTDPDGFKFPYQRQPDFKEIAISGSYVDSTGWTGYLQVRADKK